MRGGEQAMITAGGEQGRQQKSKQGLYAGGVGGGEASLWSMERWKIKQQQPECLCISRGEQQ